MKKTVLRTVFSLILSLFLAMVVLCGAVLGLAAQTVCNPDYMHSTAQNSGYSTQLYEEIAYQWENLLAITGVMEPEPIMAVLTPEKVQEDALHYLDSAFTGTPEMNTDGLKLALESEIRQYVESYYPSAEQKEEMEQNIRDLVADCISSYRSAISVPGAGYLLGAVNRVRGYLLPGILVMAAVAVLLAVFLFFLQKRRAEVLYYGAVAMATDAAFLLGIPALAQSYRVMERLPLSDSALKTLLQSFLKGILDRVENAGWLVAVCVGLLLLGYGSYYVLRKAPKQKPKPEAPASNEE